MAIESLFNSIGILSLFNIIGISGVISSLVLWKKKILNKQVTLSFMYLLLFLSLYLAASFNKKNAQFQFVEGWGSKWSGFLSLGPLLGVDGVSVLMITLTCFIFPLAFLSTWDQKEHEAYPICFLYFCLEYFTLNVFMQLNILFFFIFFEAVLLPMVVIIGVFGGRPRRVAAAYRFFFYTLFGSLITLSGIIIIYTKYGSLNLIFLKSFKLAEDLQKLLWILFFFGFAVKIPMVLFHSWLPEAHTEAPTAGSVILAAIMLKLGGFGFFRISLLIFPLGSVYWAPMVYLLSGLAVVYISLIAIVQVDLKRMIAYSSIAHMGFVTAGLFSFNHLSLAGAVFVMISHGLVSSALFFSVGVLYDRYKTRSIFYYRGLVTTMPMFSAFLFFFMLANSALPGTSAFIGEFLVITGIVFKNKFFAFLLCLNTFLVIIYSLWVFNRICFGKIETSYILEFSDLTFREFFILANLSAAILFFGLFPNSILSFLSGTLPYVQPLSNYESSTLLEIIKNIFEG